MRPRGRMKIFGVDDALLGAGAGLLGGIVNNFMAGSRQEDAQMFNAQQAAVNRDFQSQEAGAQRQWASGEAAEARRVNLLEAERGRNWSERMASSAYQRTMNDMRQAGLNPILAYRQGQSGTPSASVATSGGAPGGSAASGAQAAGSSPAQVFDIVGPALSTAVQMMRVANETKLADANVENLKYRTETEKYRPKQVEEETAYTGARYQTEKHRTTQEATAAREAKFKMDLLENQAFETLYKAGLVTKAGAGIGSDVLSTAKQFMQLRPRRSTVETTTQHVPGGSSTFQERFDSAFGR